MKIKIKDLKISYKKKGETILKIKTLEFNEGEFVAIIGPSGSGKSTFFKSLLAATYFQNGQILIDHQNIKNLKGKELQSYRQSIAYLSQENNIILDDDVYTNIKRTLQNKNNWFLKLINYITKNDMKKIEISLKKLNMQDFLFTKTDEMSGGQLQRIEIAKVLLKKPQLILADEPNSSLDIENSHNVLKLLKKMAAKNDAITLINMHDLSLLENKKLFTRVILILKGEIKTDIRINKWNKEKYKHLFLEKIQNKM